MSFYPKVNAAPERLDIVTSTSSATSCDVLIACAPGTCGNVGQLAVDVLALNLNLHRVGAVDFEHLVPVTGRDALFDDLAPDDVGAVASACEVYAGKVITANGDKTSVVAVQIRSDANIGARRVFCDEYVNFITSFASAKRIVLMSSLPSTYGALASQIGRTKWRRSGRRPFVKVCDACELPELESNVRAPDDEDEPSVDPHWALVDALRARDASGRAGAFWRCAPRATTARTAQVWRSPSRACADWTSGRRRRIPFRVSRTSVRGACRGRGKGRSVCERRAETCSVEKDATKKSIVPDAQTLH